MRVLHVLDVLRPSGAEVGLRVAAPLWSAHDVFCELLSVGEELGPYAGVLREAGYPVHHVPQDPATSFVPRYLGLLRARRPDVVHIHVERANFHLAVLARLAGVRRLVLHSLFAFTGTLRLERRVQRRILRALGATFVSVSASVQRAEAERFGNPTQHLRNWFDDVRFVPPTADERAVARVGFGLAEEDFAVTSVGNCSEIKNHEALLRALPLVPGATYLHVGIEVPDLAERALAERLGLGGRVRFLGQRDDVERVLHAADCFVMPSRYEGLGVAAVEAFGCGIPSVLADVPGLRDFAALGLPLHFAAPEAAPLAAALNQVAGLAPEARARHAAALSAGARAHFAADGAVAEYAKLYRTHA